MICTPHAGYAYRVRFDLSVGSLSGGVAYYGSYGVRPDLVENATE
jgi:hypothetical protein